MKTINSYSLLVIGKAQESTETGSFKRYVGVGASKILAFNPTKEQLDEIMGYEFPFTPVYTDEKDGEKIANVYFVVQTDPELCNGIDVKNLAIFTLRAKPALNMEGDKVQVIDDYGNYCKVNYEDAKAHKPLPDNYKIDHTNYRIACEGEVNLTVFLKKFLNIPNSLDYTNGVWTVKKDAAENAKFRLERIKDFFKGDFSEIKEALDYMPNNRIKLLYGVKTKEDGNTFQVVCTDADYTLRNAANATTIAKAASDLASAKAHNKYQNIDYRVCELQEWDVKPTNLDTPKEDNNSDDVDW